jgi:hypothetical protein
VVDVISIPIPSRIESRRFSSGHRVSAACRQNNPYNTAFFSALSRRVLERSTFGRAARVGAGVCSAADRTRGLRVYQERDLTCAENVTENPSSEIDLGMSFSCVLLYDSVSANAYRAGDHVADDPRGLGRWSRLFF